VRALKKSFKEKGVESMVFLLLFLYLEEVIRKPFRC